MIPTPILAHNPNIISIGSAVFAQITAESPYTLQWHVPPPSKLPIPMGDLNPHLIHGTLDAPEFRTQTSSQSVYLFLYRLAQSVPILDTGMPLPVKIAPSYGGRVPLKFHHLYSMSDLCI